nr:hypothetical protein B456_003G071400 [Ipomoea batatas]GME09501.1 hypothetical protein B456_003G071400 [Ipomoea batatas]
MNQVDRIQCVEQQNTWPRRFYYPKDTTKMLIGGALGYFYTRCSPVSLHSHTPTEKSFRTRSSRRKLNFRHVSPAKRTLCSKDCYKRTRLQG